MEIPKHVAIILDGPGPRAFPEMPDMFRAPRS